MECFTLFRMTLADGVGRAFIRFRHTGMSRDMVVTFAFDGDSWVGNPGGAASAIDTVFSGLQHASDILVGNTYEGVNVDIQVAPGLIQSAQHDHHVVGTFNTAGLPLNCAILMHKRSTAGSGRHYQGRWYLPPVMNLGEGDVDAAGALSSINVTAQTNVWTTFVTNLAAADVTMLLLSRTGVTYGAVSSMQCDPIIATMRRRLRP